MLHNIHSFRPCLPRLSPNRSIWPLLCCALLLGWGGCSSPKLEERDENGRLLARFEINPKDSSKNGLYESFYDDGTLYESSTYIKDTLNGTRQLFHENGKLYIEEQYEMGQFEGPYRSFYENGQLQSEGQYIDNKMAGLWELYYPDGTLKAEITFRNNLENGPFKTYHPNGNLHEKGEYKDGDNIHGTFMIYDTSGQHVRTMEYNKGRGKVTWTREGAKFD